MRIHHKDGAYVGCFLRDCVPRLYDMTDADSSKCKAESTVERKAYPDLSHVKQSCYPPMAPKKATPRANAESKLPVVSPAEDTDSESEMPAMTDSSDEEGLSKGPTKTETSDSESDGPIKREGHSSPEKTNNQKYKEDFSDPTRSLSQGSSI